ncbi:aldehyde dehydrogenase family protein [Rhodococcus opacus]|uniref:aldehyde dehydrogenase family protein n=1 Tax=Rhodococcus opacus TaxID=37919 RepID=UPI002F41511C
MCPTAPNVRARKSSAPSSPSKRSPTRTTQSAAPTTSPSDCPHRSGRRTPRRSHDVAARIDAGTVWVNSHLVLANEVPWGGFKGSGYGRDLSIYALDDYSRTKHIMHNHGR